MLGLPAAPAPAAASAPAPMLPFRPAANQLQL